MDHCRDRHDGEFAPSRRPCSRVDAGHSAFLVRCTRVACLALMSMACEAVSSTSRSQLGLRQTGIHLQSSMMRKTMSYTYGLNALSVYRDTSPISEKSSSTYEPVHSRYCGTGLDQNENSGGSLNYLKRASAICSSSDSSVTLGKDEVLSFTQLQTQLYPHLHF